MFKNKQKFIIPLIFVFLFLFGLFFIKDVGPNFDEGTEQSILAKNLREYAEILNNEKILKFFNDNEITPISIDIERDHGIAPYYFFSPFLLLRNVSNYSTSVSWHIYTYCLFFIGVIYFYKLLNYLFKEKKISLLGAFLYFFSPRILMDALHNNKDIVFMSLIVMMLYYILKWMKEKNGIDGLKLSIIAAFVCNVKVLGLFFFGLCGLGYLLILTLEKAWNKKNFWIGVSVALTTILLYILLTPAIWGSEKFVFIDFIKYCLENSVNFRANPVVLFEGVQYLNPENPLPWYYLPKLMFLTLPIIVSILGISGMFFCIFNGIKKMRQKQRFTSNQIFLFLVFICFLIPFLIALTTHPNIYNGWRHFYFLYGFLMIFVGVSLKTLWGKNTGKKVTLIFCFITLATNCFLLGKYSIRNTTYYNCLVGNKNLATIYELDYYNATGKDALKKFLGLDSLVKENEKIALYGDGMNERILEDVLIFGANEFKEKIEIVKKEDLEQKLKEGKTIYFLMNTVYPYEIKGEEELIYSYKRGKNEIINFYKVIF